MLEPVSWKGKALSGASSTSGDSRKPSQSDVFIAVMGVTGSGKTTFISKCCPAAAADIGHGLASQTKDITAYSFMFNETNVYLIDTPGFDDTQRSDTEVLIDLATWLSAFYQLDLKLSGILYLHRITDAKLSGSSMRNLSSFQQLCGNDSLSSVSLVTTMWDRVENKIGIERERELVSKEDFWGKMVVRGSFMYRHTGSEESARIIISSTVQAQKTTVLQIQRELVDEGKELSETQAGLELSKDLKKIQNRHVEELNSLRQDLKSALAEKDNQLVQFVEQERLDNESKIQKIVQERDNLLAINIHAVLAEKEVSIAQMKEEFYRETLQLRNEVAEKERKIQLLQESAAVQNGFGETDNPMSEEARKEQRLDVESLLQQERFRNKATEAELLAVIETERKQIASEREELARRSDSQLVAAVLAQLGYGMPPPYDENVSSPRENLQRGSSDNDKSQISFSSPISIPRIPETGRVLDRPIPSLLRRIHALWAYLRRPEVPLNHRRVEWICECGDQLYADFDDSSPQIVDELERLLKSDDIIEFGSVIGHAPCDTGEVPHSTSEPHESPVDIGSSTSFPATTSKAVLPSPLSDGSVSQLGRVASQLPEDGIERSPKYLALCVNTGSIYKTLVEFEVSNTLSDADVFRMMKEAYVNLSSIRVLHGLLIKPVDVHFVHFRLWHLREGYVSIHDKPTCVPPPERREYDYEPRPLVPRQPFPPETLLHYLNHKDTEFLSRKRVWTPRLPKRLAQKIIQCPVATEGWGIHIVEGPNRDVIFWIVMATVFGGVLASVLWSTLRKDIQGGTGLGSLVVALPAVIMAAFLFKLNGA